MSENQPTSPWLAEQQEGLNQRSSAVALKDSLRHQEGVGGIPAVAPPSGGEKEAPVVQLAHENQLPATILASEATDARPVPGQHKRNWLHAIGEYLHLVREETP